jgi:hypothetical protein
LASRKQLGVELIVVERGLDNRGVELAVDPTVVQFAVVEGSLVGDVGTAVEPAVFEQTVLGDHVGVDLGSQDLRQLKLIRRRAAGVRVVQHR